MVEVRTPNSVTVQSPAKINWTLAVLGRRPDGFHEIESLVSAITLADTLHFTESDQPGVSIQCHNELGRAADDIPTDQRNLIHQAAIRLAGRIGRDCRVRCELVKRIPAGGGLGGGSSNAAATLLALNAWWHAGLSVEQLMEIGAELGSDVPLFLHDGPVVMRGRGERLEAAGLPWDGWIVLLVPDFGTSTAQVYRAWQDGSALKPDSGRHRDAQLSAVQWLQRTYNMLEQPARQVYPQLGALAETLEKLAGRPVRLSGSGSTMYTIFDDQQQAGAFARQAGELVQCRIARPILRGTGMQIEMIAGDRF